MFKRFFHRSLSVKGLLSAIAIGLITPALLNRRAPPKSTDDFTLPAPIRAVVIDPVTQAVTLEAINGH